jgi:hypothetical protein
VARCDTEQLWSVEVASAAYCISLLCVSRGHVAVKRLQGLHTN